MARRADPGAAGRKKDYAQGVPYASPRPWGAAPVIGAQAEDSASTREQAKTARNRRRTVVTLSVLLLLVTGMGVLVHNWSPRAMTWPVTAMWNRLPNYLSKRFFGIAP